MTLTDMTIRTLDAPPSGQKTYWDESLPGFGCRISQGGIRTFVVVHGRHRQRTTIGRYPIITLSQARQRAKEILAASILGKLHAPSHVSFADAVERFLETHGARSSTCREYRRLLTKHFIPRLRHEPIERVSTHDLTRIIDKLADRPSEARHSFAVAVGLFNWAVARRLIQFSPLSGIKPPRANRSRERVLTDAELLAVLTKARSCSSSMGGIAQLCILTGQRRGEIGGLRRSYIDKTAQTITWPGAVVKNGRTHTIPYGPMVAAVLDAIPNTGDLLFPARGSDDKPYCGWSRTGLAFTRSCRIAHWTLHDLRRTFASGLQRLGVRMEVTEKLLNHVSGSFDGIVAIYQRHGYEKEKREAIQLWEAHLQSLLQKGHEGA